MTSPTTGSRGAVVRVIALLGVLLLLAAACGDGDTETEAGSSGSASASASGEVETSTDDESASTEEEAGAAEEPEPAAADAEDEAEDAAEDEAEAADEESGGEESGSEEESGGAEPTEEEAEAMAAWALVFDSTADFADKAPHLEDAASLESSNAGFLAAGEAMGGISLAPSNATIDGATATVVYDVLFGENAAYSDLDGTITLVDGVWVVSRDSYCGFLASARTPCEE